MMKKLILIVGVCILVADSFGYFYKPPPTPQPVVAIEPVEKSVVTFTPIRTVNAAQIAAAQTSFIGTVISTPVSEVGEYRLGYEIEGKDGSRQPIAAKVYIPIKSDNYPLFVFGAGTTGLANKCAPSLENMAIENLGNYDNQMLAQTAQGYVSVLPDYEQTYFISDSEAKVLLGAIQSLLELQLTIPSLQNADLNTVFLAGYSQGGHAAMSAATHWRELPSTVKLRGVIQYAGAANVEALFWESPWLAPYLVDSFTQYYGNDLNPQSVLQDRWLIPLAKNNAELCVNQAYSYYPHTPGKMYNPAFLDAIETHTWPASLDSWQQVISLNTPASNFPDVAYLSIQGEADPIVTASTQRANVAKLCLTGKKVTYREYPGVNHFQIRQASFIFSNDWMKAAMSGDLLQSNCP